MNFRDLFPAHFGGSPNNLWNRLFAGQYEKDVVNFYKKYAPYDVSVDIGAGVGYHTKRLAKISRKVIAIDPMALLSDMPDNVEVHNVAVGRKHESRRLYIAGTQVDGYVGAESSLGEAGHYPDSVRVVPLDDIVTEADFLKIDVEGWELEVLEPSSILNSVDYVAIELHNVRNLVSYQTGIFKMLKNFRVFASELKSYVTLDDIPLKERKDRAGRIAQQFANNHRLLCERVQK